MNKNEAIRQRLMEEMAKLPYKNFQIGYRIDCDPSVITQYKRGVHLPGAYHLAGLHEIGVDVIYILSGERTK